MAQGSELTRILLLNPFRRIKINTEIKERANPEDLALNFCIRLYNTDSIFQRTSASILPVIHIKFWEP